MPMDAKKLDELRAKHGQEVIALEVHGEVACFKKPTRVGYSKFRQYLLDPDKKHMANEALLGECIVFPEDSAAREAIFDKYPALIDTFAGPVAQLAGAGVEAKKL